MKFKNRWKKAACLILTIISTVCLGKVDVKAADYWPDAPETLSPGVILMEESTGTILYEKNSDEAHYPAIIGNCQRLRRADDLRAVSLWCHVRVGK